MEPYARALVRWRWVVLVVWTVIGVVAAVRAPATPGRLNTRGGSARETEASRTEKLLNERFARPIGEFFAISLEGPSRFDSGPSRAVLDSCSPPWTGSRMSADSSPTPALATPRS